MNGTTAVKVKNNFASLLLFTIISSLFLLLCTLTTIQEQLIYPGIKRQIQILNEPFLNINNSYYKKGNTGILWVLFGGNDSLPIDFVDITELSKHSFLIITYPGYNNTPLKPSPDNISNLTNQCLVKVQTLYNYNIINFMAYSIGCAAAIYYLSQNRKIQINKLVLLAPFWSLDEIVHSKYPFPTFIIKKLLNHNWENEKLKDIDPKIDVSIFHGKNDKLINFNHSERLSKLKKCKIIFTDDDHTSIRNKMIHIINE